MLQLSNDILNSKQLTKEAQDGGSQTSPEYISDTGEVFTATDLVKSWGTPGHKRHKKWKAHSLSSKVNSAGYGRVK